MVTLDALLARARRPAVLGLRITAEGWNAAYVRRENGSCRTVAVVFGAAPVDTFARDPAEAGRELAKCLRREHIREKRCAVCVPPEWMLTLSTELPDMPAEDVRAYLELCAERELLIPPTDLNVAYTVCRSPDAPARATVAALPGPRMQAVREMLAAAGLKGVSFAVDIGASVFDAGPAEGLDLVAGAFGFYLVFRAGGGMSGLEALPGRVNGVPDTAALLREIKISLARQPEALRRRMNALRLVGDAAALEPLREHLEKGLAGAGPMSVECVPVSADSAAVTAVAEAYLFGRSPRLGFAAPAPGPRLAWRRHFSHRTARVGAGAAAVVLLLGLVLVGVRSCQDRRLSEWLKRSGPTADELSGMQEQIRRYRSWYEDSPVSIEMLSAVTEAFPEEGTVWMRKLAIREDGRVACSGLARRNEDFMAVLAVLRGNRSVADLQVQQVRNHNPVQFAFDFVWEERRGRKR